MPRLTTPTLTPNAPFHAYMRALRTKNRAPSTLDLDAEAHRARYYVPPPQTDAARPGRDDALLCPSRVNNRRHYRDGRVTDMEGRPL